MFSARFASEVHASLCLFIISVIPTRTLQRLLHMRANTAFLYWRMKLMRCSLTWWAVHVGVPEMRLFSPCTKCFHLAKEAYFYLIRQSPTLCECGLRG